MSENQERVLNGFVNVLFIGLPIALVLMFGEKFSLWINLLTLGCVLFVSAVLSMVGDEYESPKRIIFALIGASLAACLKVLAYPGHTTVIILATIMIICVYDLINRGEIIWLEFYRSARLKFVDKFILLSTFLFIVSLVVANFGSQAIWIPIGAACLIVLVLFGSDKYLDLGNLSADKIMLTSLGALLLTGLTSTVIEFWSSEIIWGLKLWEMAVFLLLVGAIIATPIISSLHRKKRMELKKIREQNAAEEQRRAEEVSKKAAEEVERKERGRKLDEQRLRQIEDSKSLDAMALSFIYEYNKDMGLDFVYSKEFSISNLCENITVSNNKKQIVWNRYFHDSLLMLLYAAEKSFEDESLDRLIKLMKDIRANVKERKDKKIEYAGETLLMSQLQEIENVAKK